MNIHKILTTAAAALFAAAALAQNSPEAANSTESMLREVEKNNSTLEALRKSADAEKIRNRTGILLADPEVGFSYLWGDPASIGNRQDVSVTQSIDFGTVSGLKNKVAAQKNSLVEWQYLTDRMNILLEAKLTCIELTYNNLLIRELERREENAALIAESQRSRLESGEGNVLDYNNAVLSLASVENELTRARAGHKSLLSKLSGLNGGMQCEFAATEYDEAEFPASFELWYGEAQQKNPVLAYVKEEIELSRKELSLSRTENLPSLSVGYMGEFTLGQRYQGVSFGVSIPLWSNARKVKQAKAAVQAAQSREADAKQQFYSKLEAQYVEAEGLKDVAEKSRVSLERSDNRALLEKALDEGEISVPEYIVGVGLYYDALRQTLEAERDYQVALAELFSYML